MALTGVLRPGHAQIRVTELEPAIHFYRDVLGLVETGRDSVGRVYFKAWDERDITVSCCAGPTAPASTISHSRCQMWHPRPV